MAADDQTCVNPGRDLRISGTRLRALSTVDYTWSVTKVVAYFAGIALFASAYVAVDNLVVRTLAVIGLGVTFAHGLELQHEALHGNLFRRAWLDRTLGFVFGAPMLVSFTQYRAYHLYHHRFVGTDRDEELFDYSISSLKNPVSFVVRAWNLVRIPAFVATFLRMLQNEYPDKVAPAARRRLFVEYAMLLGLLAAAVVAITLFDARLALMLWIVPWLAIAEPVHFMIELPEHLGCNRATSSVLRNTRSYATSPAWAYLTNYNNYHIEHHLYPGVPAHRLGRLHEDVRAANGHCTRGYWRALREVVSASRADRAS